MLITGFNNLKSRVILKKRVARIGADAFRGESQVLGYGLAEGLCGTNWWEVVAWESRFWLAGRPLGLLQQQYAGTPGWALILQFLQQ